MLSTAKKTSPSPNNACVSHKIDYLLPIKLVKGTATHLPKCPNLVFNELMFLFLQPWELHKISHHGFSYLTFPTSNTPHPFPNPSLLSWNLLPLPKTSYFLENVCFRKGRKKRKKNCGRKLNFSLLKPR